MDEPWTKTMHSLTSHRRPELGSSAVPVGCLHNPLGLLAGREQQSLRGWNHLCSASQRGDARGVVGRRRFFVLF
jgi:hypothetical protein